MEEYREEQIDLRDYLRVLIKRRWIIMTIFVVVVLTVAVHTFTATPIYKATARIVIEKENPNLVSIQEVMAVDSTGSDYYQTQYKIIESRNVAREVIQRLDLANSPEFFPKPREGFFWNIKTWISDTVHSFKSWITSLIKTDMPDAGPGGIEEDEFSEDSALVSTFLSRIDIIPIRNSRLVDVSVEAINPAMSARMANELVRSYIDQNLETKLVAAKDAVKWLSERIEEERKKVEDTENALLQYKEDNQIITDFSSDSEQITAQKLATLNNQVVEAESRRVEAETRYQQALAVGNVPELLDSIPEVLSNDLVKEIKKMEVNLYNQMSELSKKYGSNHPKMVAIESELVDLNKRKASEAQRVVHSLRNEYQLAVAREESLKNALAGQKTETLDLNKKAVQYGALKRQAESTRNIYDLLIRRFKETSLTEEMKAGNIRMVDKAEVPTSPVKPNKKLNVLLAMIVGLTLGVGIAFFLEYLDNTIKLPDEVKDQLGIPYLGPAPAFEMEPSANGKRPDLVTIHSPKSTASESFRGIRTSILFSSADAAPQVLLVTSAGPSEGKTICASNLAVTMAQSGSKVLVLDCDMRRPRIHKVFNIGREIGASGVLIGQNGLKEAIITTDIENLDVLPVGQIPPNPSEILGSHKMAQMLETLKQSYDRIIMDSPPVTAVTDAIVLSKLVDGVILIVRAGDTPKQVIQNAISQLRAVNAHILGAVLNGIQTGKDSYYYYQYYYYYYGDDGERKKKNKRRKQRTSRYYSSHSAGVKNEESVVRSE